MKISYSLLSVGLLLASCAPKIQLRKDVSHSYKNVSFSAIGSDTFNYNGLSVKISPVDAASINSEAFKSSTLGGDYERESYSSTDYIEDVSGLTSLQRAAREAKINATNFLNRLVREETINYKVGRNFFDRIVKEEEFGMDGSEVVSLSKNEDYGKDLNPYYIKGQYLSVFKIVIQNSSTIVRTMYRNNFQILNENTQITPFSDSNLLIYNPNNFAAFLNSQRMNFPDSILVAPSSEITKYIGVPGLNVSEKKVKVNYLGLEDMKSIEFASKIEKIDKEYVLQHYSLTNHQKLSQEALIYTYVVEMEDGRSFALRNSSLYLESNGGNKFRVHTIGISPNGKDVYYSVSQAITQPTAKKRAIDLKFQKAKRYR